MDWLKADEVYLTDGGHTEEYKAKGIDKKLLRQGTPEQFCYWTEEEKVNDIVFLGSHNPTFPYSEAQSYRMLAVYYIAKRHSGKAFEFLYKGYKLAVKIGNKSLQANLVSKLFSE